MHLKQKYGRGYRLTLKPYTDDVRQDVLAAVMAILPDAVVAER